MGLKDILVVSAHAADYCTRAGGTLITYANMGYSIHIIALTCGTHGESAGYWKTHPKGTHEDCASIRRQESTEAAKKIGATIEFLNWEDYPLTIDTTRTRFLISRVLDIRPEIIFTHYTTDPTNPDHAVTGNAVVMACNSASQLGAIPDTQAQYYPNIYFFESTVPMSEFNQFSPDFYIDVTYVHQEKIEAIQKFVCQPQLKDFYIHFARHRAFQARVWTKLDIEYAEGFKRFSPYVGTKLPISERKLAL